MTGNGKARLCSLELFSGAGGMALGLDQAGFHHLALVEYNKHACETIRRNRDWPLFECDVREFSFKPYEGMADLLAAGAPCQPFSLGGQHAGESDERNMFPQVFRAIRTTRPKLVLLENVKGLTRASFEPYLEYIEWQLRLPWVKPQKSEDWIQHKERLSKRVTAIEKEDAESSYNFSMLVLDCADYGTPQRRSRVFMVGVRRDLNLEWNWPEPRHDENALLYGKWGDRSYWVEHGIKPRPLPSKLRDRVRRLSELGVPSLKRWRTLRDALRGLPKPVEGKPHPDYPNHMGVPGARRYKGHSGSELDYPAKTIKAGVHGVPGGEGTVLLDDGLVRYLTVREAARVQCFPDDYEFAGARSEAMRQIGNAVPVNVVFEFARDLRTLLTTGRVTNRRPLPTARYRVRSEQQTLTF